MTTKIINVVERSWCTCIEAQAKPALLGRYVDAAGRVNRRCRVS